MSESMIERVALAMANWDSARLDIPLLASVEEFRFDSDRQYYEDMARAAIEAMREPTKKMVDAGYTEIKNNVEYWDYGNGDNGYAVDGGAPSATWQAMIDHALSEK